MINPQCFEIIALNKSSWTTVRNSVRANFKHTFLLFDWDEIFVVDFDDVETRSTILNKRFDGKWLYD